MKNLFATPLGSSLLNSFPCSNFLPSNRPSVTGEVRKAEFARSTAIQLVPTSYTNRISQSELQTGHFAPCFSRKTLWEKRNAGKYSCFSSLKMAMDLQSPPDELVAKDNHRPRRIALFVEPSPFAYISGYKNRFQNFIKYLREMGDEVIVVTTHEGVPEEFYGAKVIGSWRYIPKYTFSWLVKPMWLIIKFLHRAADLTLVTSTVVAKELKAAKVAAAYKIRLWHKGVDSEIFHPRYKSHEMRIRLTDGEPGKPLIVHVGRLGVEKNLGFLKMLMDRLPEARLAFIGDGPYRG